MEIVSEREKEHESFQQIRTEVAELQKITNATQIKHHELEAKILRANASLEKLENSVEGTDHSTEDALKSLRASIEQYNQAADELFVQYQALMVRLEVREKTWENKREAIRKHLH